MVTPQQAQEYYDKVDEAAKTLDTHRLNAIWLWVVAGVLWLFTLGITLQAQYVGAVLCGAIGVSLTFAAINSTQSAKVACKELHKLQAERPASKNST